MSFSFPNLELINRFAALELKQLCDEFIQIEKSSQREEGNLQKIGKIFSRSIQRVENVTRSSSFSEMQIQQLDKWEGASFKALRELDGDGRFTSLINEKLKHLLDDYHELLLHQTELAERGLAGFIDEPWAQDFFKSFLKREPESAFEFLSQSIEKNQELTEKWIHWLAEGKEYAISFLIQLSASTERSALAEKIYIRFLEEALKGNQFLQIASIVCIGVNIKSNLTQVFLKFLEAQDETSVLEPITRIWLRNGTRWAERLGSIFDKVSRKIKDPILTFSILLKSVESYLEIHQLFLDPASAPSRLPIFTDLFPRAETVLVIDRLIEKEMAENLAPLGIQVVQCLSNHHESRDIWMRDISNFSAMGSELTTRIPNFIFSKTPAIISCMESWKGRFGAKEYTYGIQGSVISQLNMVEVASFHTSYSSLASLSVSKSYGEGGNLYFGRDYMLVGKDTWEITKHIVEVELKKGGYSKTDTGMRFCLPHEKSETQVSDEILELVFQSDYGSGMRVIPVEQPHKFHIDMGLALIGPNRVLLNDSVEAYKFSLKHFDSKESLLDPIELDARLKKEEELASRAKELEDLAEKDLVQAGFKVVRIPGSFRNLYASEPELQQVNFFNFLSLQAPQDRHKHIIYGLGCPESLRVIFESYIRENAEVQIDHFFYITEKSSYKCLSKSGGVRCLTRVLEVKL